MSSLRDRAEDYLRMRRALGYKLEIQGWLLQEFVAYLEQTRRATVTIENAVAWATLPARRPVLLGAATVIVRQFARHLQTIDPAARSRRRAVAVPGPASNPAPLYAGGDRRADAPQRAGTPRPCC